MNLKTSRPRSRPRNRWQDEVREDGRMVGGEKWQEKVYNREEWKKLLRTARNRSILNMLVKLINNVIITYLPVIKIIMNNIWDYKCVVAT
jgi:hypothetical protein